MIIQGKQMDNVLPTLGLFAAAAFRLMPLLEFKWVPECALSFASY